MSKIICLGIESTAHTFGVGIADSSGKILSNERSQFTTKTGGLIPAQVADHHYEFAPKILQSALDKANIGIKDIDVVAFSQGPGIGTCLNVGASVARALALTQKIPLTGVNHCVAHLEIGKLESRLNDPILLYVSGANTQVIAWHGGAYRVLGESLDIGIGNLLDTFARDLGLGFPGGPAIEKLALKGKNLLEMPYVVKGMDVSFGGILTNLRQKLRTTKPTPEDMCYSLQETAFAMLVEVSERSLAHTGKNQLVLGGGVACNERLQQMARLMCKERGAKFFVPQKQYLVDNGAMIAWNGILNFKKKKLTPIKKSTIRPYLRIEESLFK